MSDRRVLNGQQPRGNRKTELEIKQMQLKTLLIDLSDHMIRWRNLILDEVGKNRQLRRIPGNFGYSLAAHAPESEIVRVSINQMVARV